MPRVFIPQEPRRRKENGEWKPAFDMSPALVYGDPVVLAEPGPVALSAQPLVHAIRKKLMGRYMEEQPELYQDAAGKLPDVVPFNNDDFLIAVGNPTVLAVAAAVAADINRGSVQMLYWDGRLGQYVKVIYNIRL